MAGKRLYFVNSTFPPVVSGVGDYTAQLVQELAGVAEIKVLIALGEATEDPAIVVKKAFRYDQPRSILSIIPEIRAEQPDWVILQYDPFGYGAAYGINPYLPLLVGRLKQRCPQLKVGVIVHESFIAAKTWKLAILSVYLRFQLWLACRAADVIFSTVEPWALALKQWFPCKVVQHLPVSSNIPQTIAGREEVRTHLGIAAETIVLGLFGRMQRVKNLTHVTQAVHQLQAAGMAVTVLYVGSDAQVAKQALPGIPLIADGPLSPAEISRRFAAMDIYLMPVDEGISTRRTSLMVGLQHGIPTVATCGTVTDRVIQQANGKALILTDKDTPADFARAVLDLASQPIVRQQLGQSGQQWFQREFAWSQIGRKLLYTLEGRQDS